MRSLGLVIVAVLLGCSKHSPTVKGETKPDSTRVTQEGPDAPTRPLEKEIPVNAPAPTKPKHQTVADAKNTAPKHPVESSAPLELNDHVHLQEALKKAKDDEFYPF